MYTNRRRVVAVCGLVLALGASARAQSAPNVSGTVRDSALGLPLAGAIVQLLDSANRVVARTLTDQGGQYRLTASPSAVWLQALRIGFHPRNVPITTGGVAATVDIAMARLPQRLEPVVVTGNNNCPRRKDAGEAYALWDEARTGLLATVVARESRPAKMRLIEFTREMVVHQDRIDHQLVRLTDKTGADRSFQAVGGAGRFVRQGFMLEDSTRERIFFGPDADVLLDPDFAATHCFSIARADKNHPGESGLAFEPADLASRDTLVEVRGTLWVDRDKAALKSLEYRYTNLELAATRDDAGGEESFLSLANGVTLIDQWQIRFPKLLYFGAPRVRRELNHDAIVSKTYVAGGQLVSAAWPDSTSWHAKLPMIVGFVVDSVGRPLPGVPVAADSTNYEATSNARGGFVIHDVLPGPYSLFATQGNLAPLGVRIGPYADIDVRADDQSVRVRVEAHLGEAGRDFFCEERQPRGSVAFVGRLLNADRTPGADLDVHIEWESPNPNDPSGTTTHWVDAKSNSEGRFKMCGVPPQGAQALNASAARVVVRSRGSVLLNGALQFPSSDWIQAITITLPGVSP